MEENAGVLLVRGKAALPSRTRVDTDKAVITSAGEGRPFRPLIGNFIVCARARDSDSSGERFWEEEKDGDEEEDGDAPLVPQWASTTDAVGRALSRPSCLARRFCALQKASVRNNSVVAVSWHRRQRRCERLLG